MHPQPSERILPGETRQDPWLGMLQRKSLWCNPLGGYCKSYGCYTTLCFSKWLLHPSWTVDVTLRKISPHAVRWLCHGMFWFWWWSLMISEIDVNTGEYGFEFPKAVLVLQVRFDVHVLRMLLFCSVSFVFWFVTAMASFALQWLHNNLLLLVFILPLYYYYYYNYYYYYYYYWYYYYYYWYYYYYYFYSYHHHHHHHHQHHHHSCFCYVTNTIRTSTTSIATSY